MELRVGPNGRTSGLTGVSNGQGFFKPYSLDMSSGYASVVFDNVASTVLVTNKTSTYLLDPFSGPTTAPTRRPTQAPTPRPTQARELLACLIRV